MKVSIITITHNSEKYLRECISSVLSQTYPDVEYIIVDSKSSDGTVRIIKEYDEKLFTWVSEVDLGIYDGINKGLKLATGDIVGILHSDDVFADEGVVFRIVEAYQEAKADILFSDVMFINSKNKLIRHYSSKYFRPWMFHFGFQPAHPTFYTRRENFKKYGLYRPELSIAGDFELMLRFLLKKKLSYKYINDTWVVMRTGGVSNRSLKNKVVLNKEILRACKANNISSSPALICLRYLFKWWGFVFKNRKQ